MIRYITSPAAGNGSGSSWANGATIQSLGVLLGASDPGDEIHVEGGRTHISDGVTLTSTRLAGATAATRVQIRGVNPADGVPAKATLQGTLRPEPWVTGGVQGARFLKFEGGTRYVHLSDLIFHRHNEAIQFRHPDNAGFLVERCEFLNVSHAVSQASLCPALVGCTFRLLTGRGFTGNFVGMNGDTHDVLLEDVDADAMYHDDGISGKGSNGVMLGGTAHAITHRRVKVRNGGREEGVNYWNGDGFVTDNLNHSIVWEFCEASGWLDGGWDIKGEQNVLTDCEASDNKRNFRTHSDGLVELYRFKSLFPRKRGGSGSQDHFQLENIAGSPPGLDVHVYDAIVDDDDAATFVSSHTGEPTLLTFHRGSIRKHPNSPISTHPDRTVLDGTTVTNIGEEPPPEPSPEPPAEAFPVGSVFVISGDSQNPGTVLGYGTWSQTGAIWERQA